MMREGIETMTDETEETVKILKHIGGMRQYWANRAIWTWNIPRTHPSGAALATQIDGKFIIGIYPNLSAECSRAFLLSKAIPGFVFLEKLAANFPDVAAKLAEPS
jgi:hypothetical protein